MGWWDTGTKDDVAGDIPADAIDEALTKYAARTRQRHRRKPSLRALLDALAGVLRESAGDLLSDPRTAGSLRGITARGARIAPAAPAEPDRELTEMLRALVEEISGAYVDAMDRKPRLREVVANFSFVLSVDTRDYVDGVSGDIDALVVE